jgi:hypothetical protein
VLTGDKEETAVNIGYACMLLNRNMHHMNINSDTASGVRLQLQEAVEELGLLEDDEEYEQQDEEEEHSKRSGDEDEDETNEDETNEDETNYSPLTATMLSHHATQQQESKEASRASRARQARQAKAVRDGPRDSGLSSEGGDTFDELHNSGSTFEPSSGSMCERSSSGGMRLSDTQKHGRNGRQLHASPNSVGSDSVGGSDASQGHDPRGRTKFPSVQESMVSAVSRATACASQAEQLQQWDGQQLSLVISGEALYYALEQHMGENGVAGVDAEAESAGEEEEEEYAAMLSVSQQPRRTTAKRPPRVQQRAGSTRGSGLPKGGTARFSSSSSARRSFRRYVARPPPNYALLLPPYRKLNPK